MHGIVNDLRIIDYELMYGVIFLLVKKMYFVVYFQVGILKRVLEEVEKVMNEFKGMLYRSMEDPNIDLANVSFLYTCSCICALFSTIF